MKKILLSIHPVGAITDIDLEVVNERMAQVQEWTPELHDARVSDALFVNVIVHLPVISANEIHRLHEAFDHLPRMRTCVWNGFRAEVPLDKVDLDVLESAADAFSRV